MRLRIATFNLENLDETDDSKPSLQERVKVLRPQLMRLEADIVCFQEVHGQERPGEPRQLLALKTLLEGTDYHEFYLEHTQSASDEAYNERNLVVVSRYPISDVRQYRNDLISRLQYRKLTAIPAEDEAEDVQWERPILYTKIKFDSDQSLHVINLHLKSRIPTDIKGQKVNSYTWKTASGWAEGFFLSSMKRVGQALETRLVVDRIFDEEPAARIVVCGDFNAHPEEVPVEAITGRIENTGNGGLGSRVLTPCENSVPESTRFTFIHQGRRRLLDHMLISQTMLRSYKKAEIHNEMLHDETIAFAYDTKFPESDHAPFIVEFDL